MEILLLELRIYTQKFRNAVEQKNPTGLKFYLHEIYDCYQIPLINVENGLEAINILNEDGTVYDYYIEYMPEYIQALFESVEEVGDLFG